MKLAKLKSYKAGYPAVSGKKHHRFIVFLFALSFTFVLALGFASCGKDDKKDDGDDDIEYETTAGTPDSYEPITFKAASEPKEL